MHHAVRDFTGERPNALGPAGWQDLFARCGDQLERIAPGLRTRVADELAYVIANWPTDLARTAIHADLFPDNVLMLGDEVTGLIDFYFSCTDIRAYDLAVMHGSWCFSFDGAQYFPERAQSLMQGYAASHGLSDVERAAFVTLCRGAALRFLLTRAYDWINTPPDALVTRKDPLAYLRRLDRYIGCSDTELGLA
jgi:homoserine kinase type II